MRPQTTPAKEQRAADTWNTKRPVGTPVNYWRGVKRGDPSGTGRTRSEAEVQCGVAVVFIEGCSGSVALTHVEAVEAQP